MINEADYLLQDESKKDGVWADRLITHFRSIWKPIIDPQRAKKNMNIIMSNVDMSEIEAMFKDPKKLGFKLLPIIIMEKLRNILIGEKTKSGLSATVRAMDPTAEIEREGDKKLLINRDSGEELFSALNATVGLPPWQLSGEKGPDGKTPFKGNVDQFDELGLDPQSEAQISYFFRVWHKLQHEMDAQAIIDYCLKTNEVDLFITDWLNDILAKKCIAMQTFVNDMTGIMEMQYLLPEKVRAILGKRTDGKDAPAVGFDDSCTIGEMLKRFGSSIDLQRDLTYLIAAVNYTNGTSYTKVIDDQSVVNAYGFGERYCLWNDFVNFKINVGYIEFKSWNKENNKVGQDEHGNPAVFPKPAAYQINPDNTNYTQVAETVQCTYKAWYLATSTNTQRIFKFGKLYHQTLEGAEDQLSSYSVHFLIERGPTVAEISEPWIKLAQESFAKVRWMVRRAKPAGTDYNYESLVQIGKHVIKSGNTRTDIMGVIKMFEEGVDRIYTIPKVNNQPVGGGGNVHQHVENGLDKSVVDFKGLVEWAVLQIKDDIAMTQLREAYNPKANDGLQLQMQAKESSENATNYMGEMIDRVTRNSVRQILLTSQDAVKFKKSLFYKWLLGIVGEYGMARIEELGDIAMHRYGLFINSFSQYDRRKQILMETQQAWMNKEISYDIKVLVDGIDDPTKAAYVLAFEKMRKEKLDDQRAQQEHQNQMQLEQTKHQLEMQRIQAKGELDNKGKDIAGHWTYMAAIVTAQSREHIKDAQLAHEPQKIQDKTDADIRKETVKNNLKQQSAIGAGT